jgi:CRISPR-associated protein Csb2
MIALEIELLTGRYVAASFNDRGAPEWPPHPARLFSALVATASEHEELQKTARRALTWLERQGAPDILASHAEPRAVVSVFVPENTVSVVGDFGAHQAKVQEAEAAFEAARRDGDAKAVARARKELDKAHDRLAAHLQKAIADDGRDDALNRARAREMLPDHRGKQPRKLPSMTPEQPRVRYIWRDASADGATREALSELASRVVRVGHSSSLVSCRVLPEGAEQDATGTLETWTPTLDVDESGSTGGAPGATLRVVDAGQLERLDRAHERYRGVEPRVLPARHQPYRRPSASRSRPPAHSVFGEWIVLREIPGDGGRRLRLHVTRTEDVTRALRGALLHHADDPPPPALTGHAPGGRPLDAPHVAFLTLPDVFSKHASGSILGVAVVLPREIDPDDRRAILRAIGKWEKAGLVLTLGRVGAVKLERVVDGDPRRTLEPLSFTGPSRRWATVTPIALDENPGDLASRDPDVAARAAEKAEATVARACSRIGLPEPAWVQVMKRSLFDAVPPGARFMPFPKTGEGLRRVCVHAELCFTERVEGPMLLGAGRYFGLGVCAPRGVER